VALRSRECLGIRPAPLSGSATLSWLDGDRQRREIAVSQVPGSADQAYYAVTERRKALPCVSDFRRSGNQAAAVTLPRCAFRRSASLFSLRGRFTEAPTHAKEFAGSDGACPEQERCELHARTHTHSVIRELDPPAGPKPLRRGEGSRIHHASTFEFVMPGLDPGIHPSSRESFEEDGLPGQARQ
jgi:hypothetical protein